MNGTRTTLLTLFAVAVCLAGAGAQMFWPRPAERAELPPVERMVFEWIERAGSRDVDEADDPAALGTSDALPAVAEGLDALQVHVALLRQGIDDLDRHPDHAARFHRQVRVDGMLLAPEEVDLEVRHEPFSVHMKWRNGDKGRRAVYVAGANDDRMLVRLGGWKARLPPLKLEPTGPTAMRSSRHPITSAGLLSLSNRLLANREEDLRSTAGVTCTFTRDVVWNDRPCHEFVVEYATRSSAPSAEIYRKSVQYLDGELRLPILVRNFGWPTGDVPTDPAGLDDETLLEEYAYSDIHLGVGLDDENFDVGRK